MNVTVPVGLPDDDVTVAVNVTDRTKVEGLRLETTEVDVLPLTICSTALPLLAVAAMTCDPFARSRDAEGRLTHSEICR